MNDETSTAEAAGTEQRSGKRVAPVRLSAVGSGVRHTWEIWKRELGAYFSSPIAYVFITAFLLGSGSLFLFVEDFFARGEASVAPFFSWFPWLFVVLVPAITMRLWAEERNTGTIEVLTTLPLRLSEIVLGKFFGAWSFITIAVIFTLPIPIIVDNLAVQGQGLNWGAVWGGYLGTLLLSGALVAIGTYISSLFRNQILAFIVTLFACGLLTFLGNERILDFIHQEWPAVVRFVSYVSLGPHFRRIAEGVLHVKSVVYFFSLMVFFLFLNHTVLRNWKYTS